MNVLKHLIGGMVAASLTLAAFAWSAAAHADCTLDACDNADEVLAFWEGRTSTVAQNKRTQWTAIKAALTSGTVSDALFGQVETGYRGARYGGRMYAHWQAVYLAMKELRATPPPNDAEDYETPSTFVPDSTYYAEENAAKPSTDSDYTAWGPWNDLPTWVQEGIAGLTVPSTTISIRTLSIPGGGSCGSFGNVLSFHRCQHFRAKDTPPTSGTATYVGKIDGVMHPNHTHLSDPELTLNANFGSAKLSGHIGYLRDGRTKSDGTRYNLDRWSNIAINGSKFSGNGIEGTFVRDYYDVDLRIGTAWHDVGTNDRGAVVGTINRPRIVGTFDIEKQ